MPLQLGDFLWGYAVGDDLPVILRVLARLLDDGHLLLVELLLEHERVDDAALVYEELLQGCDAVAESTKRLIRVFVYVANSLANLFTPDVVTSRWADILVPPGKVSPPGSRVSQIRLSPFDDVGPSADATARATVEQARGARRGGAIRRE